MSSLFASLSFRAFGLDMKNGVRVWLIRKFDCGFLSVMATSVALLAFTEATLLVAPKPPNTAPK